MNLSRLIPHSRTNTHENMFRSVDAETWVIIMLQWTGFTLLSETCQISSVQNLSKIPDPLRETLLEAWGYDGCLWQQTSKHMTPKMIHQPLSSGLLDIYRVWQFQSFLQTPYLNVHECSAEVNIYMHCAGVFQIIFLNRCTSTNTPHEWVTRGISTSNARPWIRGWGWTANPET